MKQIITRAQINATKRPTVDIQLSHLAKWRDKIEAKNSELDTIKLEVLHSFCKLRELLQQEMESTAGELPLGFYKKRKH